MNKIKRLAQSYGNYIRIPWREDAAAPQRVLFCVYDENEELRLRAKSDEFETTTVIASHYWKLVDLTDAFAEWMSTEEYAEEFFAEPALLSDLLPDEFVAYLAKRFAETLKTLPANENTVVALLGTGALFGFAKVKDVLDEFAPHVRGRLLVFFPGSYENNNYRLLDGYDGWNYLAIPITADRYLPGSSELPGRF